MYEKATKRHKATREVQNDYKEKQKKNQLTTLTTYKTATKQCKMKTNTKEDYKGMQKD